MLKRQVGSRKTTPRSYAVFFSVAATCLVYKMQLCYSSIGGSVVAWGLRSAAGAWRPWRLPGPPGDDAAGPRIPLVFVECRCSSRIHAVEIGVGCHEFNSLGPDKERSSTRDNRNPMTVSERTLIVHESTWMRRVENRPHGKAVRTWQVCPITRDHLGAVSH